MLALLRQFPAFRTLTISRFFQVIGDTLFNIVFLVYAAQLHDAKIAVSIISVLLLLPSIAEALLSTWANRIRQQIAWLLITRVAQSLIYLALTIIFAMLPPSWVSLGMALVLIMISDTLSSLSGLVMTPIVKHAVTDEQRASANGLVSAINTSVALISGFSGATLLGMMYQNFSMFALLNAVMFVLAYITLRLGKAPLQQLAQDINQTTTPSNHHLKTDFINGWRTLKQLPLISYFVMMALVMNSSASAVDVLFSITILDRPHEFIDNNGTTIAIINAVFAIGTIVGSLTVNDWFKRISLPHMSLIFLGVLITVGTANLFNLKLLSILAIFFILAVILGKINPRMGALFMKEIPEKELITISGVTGSLSLLGAPFGQTLFVSIANIASTHLAWASFVGVNLLILIVALISQRFIKQSTI
ncbi:MFS transporter [Weissella confusa]|uniref:MFS transporter n=1 Tax=Weissella confusa TaxID=1583 RepID=UPI0022E31B28|nr:MFS transporter [Weissella confusa]